MQSKELNLSQKNRVASAAADIKTRFDGSCPMPPDQPTPTSFVARKILYFLPAISVAQDFFQN